ncbi:MAG: hypothetical protein HFJ75_00215 [Eggerthellaceae bacterium]|nr:hypothetical protein [Eggerthellaceae bacterium]
MSDCEDDYGKNNCIKLQSTLPGRMEYLYVDTPGYRADRIFIQHQIPVRFRRGECVKDGYEYVVVFCHFPKKREADFLTCMAQLERALLLEGHSDYRTACDELIGMLREAGQ